MDSPPNSIFVKGSDCPGDVERKMPRKGREGRRQRRKRDSEIDVRDAYGCRAIAVISNFEGENERQERKKAAQVAVRGTQRSNVKLDFCCRVAAYLTLKTPGPFRRPLPKRLHGT